MENYCLTWYIPNPTVGASEKSFLILIKIKNAEWNEKRRSMYGTACNLEIFQNRRKANWRWEFENCEHTTCYLKVLAVRIRLLQISFCRKLIIVTTDEICSSAQKSSFSCSFYTHEFYLKREYIGFNLECTYIDIVRMTHCVRYRYLQIPYIYIYQKSSKAQNPLIPKIIWMFVLHYWKAFLEITSHILTLFCNRRIHIDA